jgi:hypothetical protein
MKRLQAFLASATLFTIILNGMQITNAGDSEDGLVVEDKAYPFPSYEQAVQTTDVEKYTTEKSYAKAVSDRQFELRKLRYMSDGLKVVAYLYKPTPSSRKESARDHFQPRRCNQRRHRAGTHHRLASTRVGGLRNLGADVPAK